MGGEVEEDVVDKGVVDLELFELIASADEVVEGLSRVGLLPEEVCRALWLEVGERDVVAFDQELVHRSEVLEKRRKDWR